MKKMAALFWIVFAFSTVSSANIICQRSKEAGARVQFDSTGLNFVLYYSYSHQGRTETLGKEYNLDSTTIENVKNQTFWYDGRYVQDDMGVLYLYNSNCEIAGRLVNPL